MALVTLVSHVVVLAWIEKIVGKICGNIRGVDVPVMRIRQMITTSCIFHRLRKSISQGGGYVIKT